ncbi:hypothetical protein Tco_0169188 [Tanacetum coccineum]
MDDEPMWAADRVVAPIPGSTITIPETANEFDIKGNHLTLVKGNQFDGRTKTDPHKHIHEFLGICDMFKYKDTENEAVRLMMFPLSLAGEAKTCSFRPTPRRNPSFLSTREQISNRGLASYEGNAPKFSWSQSIQRQHYQNLLSWSKRNNSRSSECRSWSSISAADEECLDSKKIDKVEVSTVRFGIIQIGYHHNRLKRSIQIGIQQVLSEIVENLDCSTEDAIDVSLGLYLLPGPKVFESDIKGSTGSSSSAQNVAFVSSKSISSTNDVSNAYVVSTSFGYNSQRENSSSYIDELMYLFFEPVGFDKTNARMLQLSQKGICRDCKNQKGTWRYKSKTMEGDLEKQEEPKALVTLDGEEYESDSDDEYVIQPLKEQEKPRFAFIDTIKHVKTPRETIKEQNTYSPSPKADKRDWNGLMSKRLGLGYRFTKKECFVCGSFSHLIRDCDFHEKRMAKQVELNKSKQIVPFTSSFSQVEKKG